MQQEIRKWLVVTPQPLRGAFGCLDRATYDRMMEFLDKGGKDAFGKYVLSHLDGGCVFFNDV